MWIFASHHTTIRSSTRLKRPGDGHPAAEIFRDPSRYQIKNFGQEAEFSEVGQVLSSATHCPRLLSLDNVQSGRMVEVLERQPACMALTSRLTASHRDFRRDREIKEGQTVKAHRRRSSIPPSARALLGRVARCSPAIRSTARPDPGRQAMARRRQGARHHSGKSVHESDGDGLQCDRCLIPIGRVPRELIIGYNSPYRQDRRSHRPIRTEAAFTAHTEREESACIASMLRSA